MGTSYLHLESGVIVAQQGGGYAEIRAALKQQDDRLELGNIGGVWKVYFRYGGEPHQVTFVCDWRDPDGTPRELSSGLVDKVRSLDRNSRERQASVEDLEGQRQADLAKYREETTEALADDILKRRTISASLPRTGNRANRRWKEAQLQAQKRRRAKGLDF